MMKIIATSDLHGHLPVVPECDLLLIAGDISPVVDHRLRYQERWLKTTFADWLRNVPAKKVIGVWGNHDLIGQDSPERVPELPWTLLTDESTSFEGLSIYGLPWQKTFGIGWAFNLDDDLLNKKYEAIPTGTDIIVSHGPAYGLGDRVLRFQSYIEHTGSLAFRKKIDEVRPKLVVYGHIHCDPGLWEVNGSVISNVSMLDERYHPYRQPCEFHL